MPSVDWFFTAVPEPNEDIDFFRAGEQALIDEGLRTEALDGNPSIPTLLKVYRNCIDWSRFWSVRHRMPKARALHAALAASGEATLKEFEAWWEAKQRKEAN